MTSLGGSAFCILTLVTSTPAPYASSVFCIRSFDLDLDRLAVLGQDAFELAAADDLAHGAFGHGLDGGVGIFDVEEIVAGVLDPPRTR